MRESLLRKNGPSGRPVPTKKYGGSKPPPYGTTGNPGDSSTSLGMTNGRLVNRLYKKAKQLGGEKFSLFVSLPPPLAGHLPHQREARRAVILR